MVGFMKYDGVDESWELDGKCFAHAAMEAQSVPVEIAGHLIAQNCIELVGLIDFEQIQPFVKLVPPFIAVQASEHGVGELRGF